MIIQYDIDISLKAFEHIKNKIDRIQVKEFADSITQDNRERFISSLSPTGARIPAISRDTIATKTLKGSPFPSKPLMDSLQLYNSYKTRSISKNEAHVIVIDSRKETFTKRKKTKLKSIPTLKRGKKSARVTNTNILDYQKKAGREVFGISDKAKDKVKQRLEAISKQQ